MDTILFYITFLYYMIEMIILSSNEDFLLSQIWYLVWNLIRAQITFSEGLMQYSQYLLCLYRGLKRLFQVASAGQILSDRSADEWAWEFSVTDSWLAYEIKQPRTFFPRLVSQSDSYALIESQKKEFIG